LYYSISFFVFVYWFWPVSCSVFRGMCLGIARWPPRS
jgi:hypothetical protein